MIFRSLAVLCVTAGATIAIEHRLSLPAPPPPEPVVEHSLEPALVKTDRPVSKPIKVIPIWTPESPSFEHAFGSKWRPGWQPTVAAKPDAKPVPILASLPPPKEAAPADQPKAKPSRHRSETVQSHLERYCSKAGKTERSWIRVKGVKKFCPS